MMAAGMAPGMNRSFLAEQWTELAPRRAWYDTVEEAQEFVDGGGLGGGMLPKLQNCIDAINRGVSRVHILDGRIPHCLLLEIFTNKGIGTAILNGKEERYYHGEE